MHHSPPLSLILLPGMLCDERSWSTVVQDLGPQAQVRTAAYGDLDTIADMAQSVIATAPARFAVAGHSMGGRVALEIARAAPDRVIGLALLGSDYRGIDTAAARDAETAARAAEVAAARAEGYDHFARSWSRAMLAPACREGAVADAAAAMTGGFGLDALAAHGRAGLSRRDYSDLLLRLVYPVLVCGGEHDPLRPPAHQQAMAALLPHARFVMIEGAGHMMMMEKPDQVSRAMRDWLTDVAAHDAVGDAASARPVPSAGQA